MDLETLKNQIDYVQARIEEIDKQIINTNPSDKGYKELIDSYNKWIDRYNDLIEKLAHFGEDSEEKIKNDLERDKINLERSKIVTNNELEVDKINLESEKIRLEREKFAHEVECQNLNQKLDIIFRTADVGTKILVPTMGLIGVVYVAKLAYMNDAELKLCNGRIFGGVKDILRILTTKL